MVTWMVGSDLAIQLLSLGFGSQCAHSENVLRWQVKRTSLLNCSQRNKQKRLALAEIPDASSPGLLNCGLQHENSYVTELPDCAPCREHTPMRADGKMSARWQMSANAESHFICCSLCEQPARSCMDWD